MTWDSALGLGSRSDAPVRHEQCEVTEQPKRGDIQGLRSVAVVLVVLFHAGVTGLPGGYVGVDVFFVISGFLITGNIVRHMGDREFTLREFYANRARRLLPAAFVTIALTCVITYLILPATRFDGIARDALSSAYYAVNWRLSAQSVDYLAQNDAVSPFQHFWSLAVEEQYYLVWPLLLMAAAIVGKSRRLVGFALAVASVGVPSLAYSILFTSSNPSQAYFVTTTRMWELALGGAVALLGGCLSRIPTLPAATLGWLGIAAIVYSSIVYTGATPFPGYAAALPTAGAAAVIAAGPGARHFGPALVLGRRLPVGIGNISYSLYLWHWPLIVFATAQFVGPLPLWAGLLAAAISVVPAWLSYRFIEQPGMSSPTFASTRAGLGLGAFTSLASAAAALLLLAIIPEQQTSSYIVGANGTAVDVGGHRVKVGAEVLAVNPGGDKAGSPIDSFDSITPSPLTAKHDAPDGGKCIALITATADEPCIFGDFASTTTVDLVGDSHAMQWLPALEATAIDHHWRIVTHTKQSCSFNATPVYRRELHGEYKECTQWNTDVAKAILQDHPKLVITSSARDHNLYVGGKLQTLDASTPALINGYQQAWAPLLKAGIRIAVIAETPLPDFDVTGCVSQNPNHLTRCARPRSLVLATSSALSRAAHTTPGVTYVDFNDAICPTSQCAAVIGSVLVYRDGNHLTATYVTTMQARFARKIEPLISA